MTDRPIPHAREKLRAQLKARLMQGGTQRVCLVVEGLRDCRLHTDGYRVPLAPAMGQALAVKFGHLLILPLAGFAPAYVIIAEGEEALAELRRYFWQTEYVLDQFMQGAPGAANVDPGYVYHESSLQVGTTLLCAVLNDVKNLMDRYGNWRTSDMPEILVAAEESDIGVLPLWGAFTSLKKAAK